MSFYAVKNGRGGKAVYATWDECKTAVDGFSGAVFKRFNSKEEALEYLEDKEKVFQNPVDVYAYTDGSFDGGIAGFASVLLEPRPCGMKAVMVIYGLCSKDPSNRNVGGEIEAAEKAVEQAIKAGYKHIEICHDYEGVSKWAEGDWKTNTADTAYFAAIMRKYSKQIEISFQKIKGHSGDEYNDLADEFAKAGTTEKVVRILHI